MSRVKQSLKIKKLETGYFPLTDHPEEIRKLVEKALVHQSKTLLSLIEPKNDNRFNYTTSLVGFSSQRNSVEFALTPDLKSARLKIAPLEAMAVIFLRGSNLLCIQTTHIEWQKKAIELAAPWRVLKFQRRKEIRFEIPKAYEYYSEVPLSRTLTHKFRILDISAQGMSIQTVSPGEAALLPKNCLIPKLSFVIDGVRIITAARVASHSAVPGRRGPRIGLEFLRMSIENSHVVSAFVTRYLSQYIGD
jgi:hypothetical protein